MSVLIKHWTAVCPAGNKDMCALWRSNLVLAGLQSVMLILVAGRTRGLWGITGILTGLFAYYPWKYSYIDLLQPLSV